MEDLKDFERVDMRYELSKDYKKFTATFSSEVPLPPLFVIIALEQLKESIMKDHGLNEVDFQLLMHEYRKMGGKYVMGDDDEDNTEANKEPLQVVESSVVDTTEPTPVGGSEESVSKTTS